MSSLSKLVSSLTTLTITSQTLPYFHWSTTSIPHPQPSTSSSSATNSTLTSHQTPLSKSCRPETTLDLRTFIRSSILGDSLPNNDDDEDDAVSRPTHNQTTTSLAPPIMKPTKSIFVFGEHHHQPGVLRGQLTVLDELLKMGRQENRKVWIVFEMFNIRQQKSLASLHEELNKVDGETSLQTHELTVDNSQMEDMMISKKEDITRKFVEKYQTSREGFDMSHYLPLLIHAIESTNTTSPQRMELVGGFPPREWASYISKQGIEKFRGESSEFVEQVEDLQRSGFTRWDDLQPSQDYKAFLTSLMKGTQPDPSQFSESNRDEKGVFPAQAFKDSVMAWKVDECFRQGNGSEKGVGREVGKPLVLIIAGSGHCEYGFGVVERLRCVGREEVCVIVAKEREESAIWIGDEWGKRLETERKRKIGDAVFFYDGVDGV